MKNNLKFTEGEITIYCGKNAMTNCRASLEQAAGIAQSGRKGKILYINTFLAKRKMMAGARQAPTSQVPDEGKIIYENIGIGAFANELGSMKMLIKEMKATCVIINSWEFAHKSYSYKEQAIFGLMEIVNELGTAVLIYSQCKIAEAGVIQRGGLGKLSALASEILELEVEQELLPVAPQTDRSVRSTDSQNENLVARKINELDYARGESGVNSGGELIMPAHEVESEVMEEDLVFV